MPNGDDVGELTQENAELREQLTRSQKAQEVASYNLIELKTQRDMLSKSLAGALDLVTNLMADLRDAGVQPTMASVVGKAKLDAAARQLIARYGSALPPDEKPS